MFCQECGKPIAAGIRYCPHCGANVSGQASAPPPSVAGTPPAAAGPAPPAAPPVGQYAGFWLRLAACFIDGLILWTASLVIQALLGLGVGLGAPQRPADWVALFGLLGVSVVTSTVCTWLYEALLTSSRWQATVGKKALGIVVTDENGGRISFPRATGRHFGKWVSGLLLFAGYLIQPFTPKRQALHDILAGTLVVKP